ncbi:glycine zipper family protein [Algoriphagus algorifonticola]|uniref:glycine zipper family protein n=1 Tax=Algoriphagus algorifonticola TaxID=2593007 RepID=UPI00119F7DCF|nr:glycine zipper family protein [Algoriphagus algorifonticola]
MKKVSYVLFLISFMFSCQELEDAGNTNLNSFEDINKITNELITFNASKLSTFMTKESDGSLWMDKNQMTVSSFEHLDGYLINASGLDIELLAKPFGKERIDRNTMSNRVMNIDYGNFNMPQVWFADQLITNLLEVEDLYEVTDVVFSFNLQVLNSLLTQAEKDELLVLSSSALSIRDFLLNGGVDILYDEMILVYGDPTDPSNPSIGGRVQGCSVDTRAVWGSAVIGLTTGAVSGAYAGATGGSIAPGIGTVTGAVSGAVIGGAVGFVSGALAGVAGSLLLTCFR